MTDDTQKNLIAQLQRQMKPFADLDQSLGGNNAIARVVEDMERQKRMLSAAYGPMEELRRSGVFNGFTEQADAVAEIQKQLALTTEIQKQLALTTERFELPEIKLATKLLEEYRANQPSELVKRFTEQQDYLRRAIEAIRSPWLDMEAQMRSVGAFADIQSIGFALQNVPAFDDHLTELLRIDLGDWRDRVVFPKAIFNDPLARSAFYLKQGFDPALAAFPVDAFAETLRIAGLRGAPPPIIDAYDYEEITEEDEQETAFARTNAAHDRLQRFETQLRQFIDKKMTAACGAQWIKHRVPEQMRKEWIEKRDKASDNGDADYPLIAYADFSDYSPLITQKNNWNQVFQDVFKRATSVQESFQRLYPIRICTMHARMITQDDELYLHVETKRILSAIGIG